MDHFHIWIMIKRCHQNLIREFYGEILNQSTISKMNFFIKTEIKKECYLNSWPDLSDQVQIVENNGITIQMRNESDLDRYIRDGMVTEKEISDVVEG